MSSWSHGYVHDIEYTSGAYRELFPSHLNHALLTNGLLPPDITKPFTWCELGCGKGFTALLAAASHPQGRFWAFDFNPSHIASAQALAAEAGVENLTYGEDSFEELAAAPERLPLFDYIVLHGIYSWISEENRGHIRSFIRSRLKPGGVVYISYNCLPGWSQAMPIRRLMREYAACFAGRTDQRIEKALAEIGKLKEAKSRFFATSQVASQRFDQIKTGNRNYLAHEYMNDDWHIFYQADVARDMAEAKLSYAGSANLFEYDMSLCLLEEQRKIINELPDPSLRETVKDFFLNQQFRKDIYVRGEVRLDRNAMVQRLSELKVALAVARPFVSTKFQLPLGEVTGNQAVYEPLLNALADGPKSLQELGQAIGANTQLRSVVQAATLLYGAGSVVTVLPTPPAQMAKRLNRAIAARAHGGDTLQFLTVPLGGQIVSSSILERLALDGIVNAGLPDNVEALAPHAWRSLNARGQRLLREGKPLESEQENLTEIREQLQAFFNQKLKVWRALDIL
ncbi:MAG TPA: class I SAM-dependent methyltransferase [Azospirillaceae bacterium]|nr:class I SAM-dependent methyltransferase [Azospirillaceae bacterium]